MAKKTFHQLHNNRILKSMIYKNVNSKRSIFDRVLDTTRTHFRELKIQLLDNFPDNNEDFLN